MIFAVDAVEHHPGPSSSPKAAGGVAADTSQLSPSLSAVLSWRGHLTQGHSPFPKSAYIPPMSNDIGNEGQADPTFIWNVSERPFQLLVGSPCRFQRGLCYDCEVKVTQSCLTLCNPMDYIVHEILQARILEWVAFPFSRGSSQSRDQTQVSPHCGRILYQLSHQGGAVMTVLHNNCMPPLCAWPCFFHFPGVLILRALANHLPTGDSPYPRPFPRERLQVPGPTCAQRAMRVSATSLRTKDNLDPSSSLCGIHSCVCVCCCCWGSQVVLVVKNLPADAGAVTDVGSIPGSRRSPGGGRGNPLQYSCLENPNGQRSLVGDGGHHRS